MNIINNTSIHLLGAYTLGFFLSPVGTILHEAAHGVAYKILYKNANPHISVNFYKGGSTRPNFTGKTPVLSPVGKALGDSRAKLCVVAAGPLMELITSIFLNEVAGNTMVSNGLVFYSLLNLSCYALTAFKKDADDSHDFYSIKKNCMPAYIALTTACIFTTAAVAMNTIHLSRN